VCSLQQITEARFEVGNQYRRNRQGKDLATPQDDLGHPVPLTRPARRVVSLVPSLTESVAVTRAGALVDCGSDRASC